MTGTPIAEVLRELGIRAVERLARHDIFGYLDIVCGYARWRNLVCATLDLPSLIDFHFRHKYLLSAHSPGHARHLDQMVRSAPCLGLATTEDLYMRLYLKCISQPPTREGHVRVLREMAIYLEPCVRHSDLQDIESLIQAYWNEERAREAASACIFRHALEQEISYLTEQVYFSPYSQGLATRRDSADSPAPPSWSSDRGPMAEK